MPATLADMLMTVLSSRSWLLDRRYLQETEMSPAADITALRIWQIRTKVKILSSPSEVNAL